MRIACIGVGNMGGAVARRVAGGDFDVTVYDPSAEARQRCVAAGASEAESVAETVQDAEVVLTSLPTPGHVLAAVADVSGTVAAGTVLVDISTIDPHTARAVSTRCEESSIAFVACPLGKTPAHAETGQIPLFVGGSDEAVRRLEPLLDRMGEKTYRFGSIEAATTFKLVSNFVGMSNVAVLAEGLALATRAGIDPATFTEALADTGATSFQSDVRLPWMLDGDWAPRFGVDLAVKDVRLAVESANEWKVPVPVGSAALAQLVSASKHGWGDEDVIAVAKLSDPERGADSQPRD